MTAVTASPSRLRRGEYWEQRKEIAREWSSKFLFIKTQQVLLYSLLSKVLLMSRHGYYSTMFSFLTTIIFQNRKLLTVSLATPPRTKLLLLEAVAEAAMLRLVDSCCLLTKSVCRVQGGWRLSVLVLLTLKVLILAQSQLNLSG